MTHLPSFLFANVLLNIQKLLSTDLIDYAKCLPHGADLLFVDALDSQELLHEVFQWDSAGFSSIFVLIEFIPVGDGFFWMYFGANVSFANVSTSRNENRTSVISSALLL